MLEPIIIEIVGLAMFIFIVLASAKFQARYTWYDNHADNRVPVDADEHNLIMWKRIAYTIPVVAFWYMTFNWVVLIGAIGLIFIHPFFHNGMLFVSYNKLKPGSYLLGWKDRSMHKTSDGKVKMAISYPTRLIFLILGIVLFGLMIII